MQDPWGGSSARTGGDAAWLEVPEGHYLVGKIDRVFDSAKGGTYVEIFAAITFRYADNSPISATAKVLANAYTVPVLASDSGKYVRIIRDGWRKGKDDKSYPQYKTSVLTDSERAQSLLDRARTTLAKSGGAVPGMDTDDDLPF